MSKTKNTPGPWETSPTHHPVSDTFGIRTQDGIWVAKVHPLNGGEDRDRCEANARLIAAAPMLLETLKEIAEHGEAHNSWGARTLAGMARIAVARVEGGE